MTIENLNIFVLVVLSLGLVSTAIIKNYHYEKFYIVSGKEKVNALKLLLRIFSSLSVGLVWIFPFNITDASPNAETQKHKDMFNKTSKYFRYFWVASLIYGLFCILSSPSK